MRAIQSCLFLAVVAAALGWVWCSAVVRHCDSPVDLATWAQAPSPSSKKSSHVAVDRSVPAADTSAEVDGRLSGQVAQLDRASPAALDAEAYVAGSNPALAATQGYEIDPGMLPTWEGLWSMTVELWSQEEFMEAEALTVHVLPTEDECRLAMQDDAVKLALTDVCAYDLTLVRLSSIPTPLRSAKTRAMIDGVLRERANSMAALTERLDRISGYRTWSEMDRLYREWSR